MRDTIIVHQCSRYCCRFYFNVVVCTSFSCHCMRGKSLCIVDWFYRCGSVAVSRLLYVLCWFYVLRPQKYL